MSDPIHVFDRLLEIALLLQHDLDSSLEASGLTPARAHLLWELHHRGPSTQQSLAVALKVTPRNVTGLVDAVQTAGFAHRQPHPTDRRATLVTLTERGTQAMAAMKREREEAATQLVLGLNQPELDQFSHSLDIIADRLRSMMAAAEVAPRRPE